MVLFPVISNDPNEWPEWVVNWWPSSVTVYHGLSSTSWCTAMYRREAQRRAGLSAAAETCFTIPTVLYTHRCSIGSTVAQRAVRVIIRLQLQPTLLMSTGPQLWSQQSSTTTKVVDHTAYSSASAPSWMQTTVVDGHKFLEVRRLSQRLLDRSKLNFSYPTCIWRSFWGWSHRNFVEIFRIIVFELSCGFVFRS